MSRAAHPAGPRHADVLPEPGPGAPPGDLDALASRVWPRGAGRDDDGVLRVGGVDVRELAGQFGTPAYVLDEEDFRVRARGFRDAFASGGDVYYAAKAFLCRAVVRWVEEEGLGLDVASGGELAVALAGGFPPDRIILHGNNKSVDELTAALDAGVGRVVLDSFEEIARLDALATGRGVVQPVLVRVTVGVEAHTHEYIATAHEDQKFGFSLVGGDAAEAVRRVLAAGGLRLLGLHSHIGSQIFDPAGFEVAAHRVVGLLGSIRDEHGVVLDELDLGGGFGIAYVDADDPIDPAGLAAALRHAVADRAAELGLPPPRLAVEPGRAIVGPAMVTLYEVGTVKPVALDGRTTRTYVSVDGGMSDNIRTALYDAQYSVALASRRADGSPMVVRVVGKHCESGDIVVRDSWLPADLVPGDLLAVPATGAYCRSMARNYTQVPRPPVVAVRAGSSRLLLRRETLADLLATDLG
ncbi:MAG: diaminopimelate decarboxylase [Actinomycetes bacterium]